MLTYKYDLTQADPVIMEIPVVNATYTAGMILKPGAAEAGGAASAGAGSGKFYAVTQEAKVAAGTQAAGTIETLKCIVNPFAVYAVPYDLSGRITWATSATTSITFACTSTEGHPNIGGGWAWSYNTGYLDYIVSSATSSTTCTLTTVTGTSTANTTGILLYPAGSGLTYPVCLNSDASTINADNVDLATAGTNGFTAIVLSNVITSKTYGAETLTSAFNKQIRGMAVNTSLSDVATAEAYVSFAPYSIFVA